MPTAYSPANAPGYMLSPLRGCPMADRRSLEFAAVKPMLGVAMTYSNMGRKRRWRKWKTEKLSRRGETEDGGAGRLKTKSNRPA